MSYKRLFTALRFPESTINELAEVQKKFKEIDPKARFVEPITNFHITLYFIGNVEDQGKIERAVDKACQEYRKIINRPIKLEFTSPGLFRNRGGKILWVGVKETEDLVKLASLIKEEVAKTEVPVDKKKFRGHITIARKYRGEIPEDLPEIKPIIIDKAALVWSHRNKDDVLVYDNLAFYNLTD